MLIGHLGCIVCVQVGYLTSYWDVPYFPEWCRDPALDSSTAFDTTIRVAGSWSSFGASFRAIMATYGWRRVVVASDTDDDSSCFYGAKSMNDAMTSGGGDDDDEIAFFWIRMASDPSDVDIDDYLEQVRNRSRGA